MTTKKSTKLAQEVAVLRGNMDLDRAIVRKLAGLRVGPHQISGFPVLLDVRDGASLVDQAKRRKKAWKHESDRRSDQRNEIIVALAKAVSDLEEAGFERGCDCSDCKADMKKFRKAVRVQVSKAANLARREGMV